MEKWFKASDGTAMRTKATASLVIRQAEIPQAEGEKKTVYVVCALYATGQVHHDLSAYATKEMAVKEIQRLTKLDIE